MSSSEDEPETKKSKLSALPACPYGSSCYRKNPQHFKEFSHPGSSKDTAASKTKSDNKQASHPGPSKSSSPSKTKTENKEDLPECEYGVNCYRKNLLHFAEFSHPFKSDTKEPENNSSGSDTDCDTDVLDSDTEQQNKKKDDKENGQDSTLTRATSLVKKYSQMTEDERKDLIKKALEMKEQLQKELSETKKQVEEKSKELDRLQKQVNSGLLLEGEKEALAGTKITYFPLIPERHYKEGSAAQVHFRLAESQFYRLLSGAYSNQYRVSKVEYVVNPALVKKFKKSQEQMKENRGEEFAYPILAFHGTEEKNIIPICETGFKVPGTDDPRLAHRMSNEGLYGKGIYFSEFTHYSIAYVAGANKILLNKVLPGKVYHCSGVTTGIPLKSGHDSHMSPCKKELVIFYSQRILPCYIVHYKTTSQEFKYVKPTSAKNKLTRQDELMKRYWKAKKAKTTRCFAGHSVRLAGKLCDSHKELGALVKKHDGTFVAETAASRWSSPYFTILVTTEKHQEKGGTVYTQAMSNKAVVVRQEFLYDCILKNMKLEPEDYELE